MQSAVFVCSWISGKFSQAVNYWKVQIIDPDSEKRTVPLLKQTFLINHTYGTQIKSDARKATEFYK